MRDDELIFKTRNRSKWERSVDHIYDILDILFDIPGRDKKDLRIKFEQTCLEEDNFTPPNSSGIFANMLISGGADSLCGAFHYRKKISQNVIFTHVFHKNTPSINMIRNFVKDELKAELFILDGQFDSEKGKIRELAGKSKETEMFLGQTRTLMYLGYSLAINYALGIKNLYITENGPFTINPPFFQGYEFTNTTNPDFIQHFNQFLNLFLGQDILRVFLPFRNYTKAELMASVPANLLMKTHSCSRLYSQKSSCFNCHACYIRRFSAYAYGNNEDDFYCPEGVQLPRYNDDDGGNSQKKSDYFKAPGGKYLPKLIKFCHDFLEHGSRDYILVARRIRELRPYYEDINDLLTRFCKDILVGISNFYQHNTRIRSGEHSIWNLLQDCMSDLETKSIVTANLTQEAKSRIITKSLSIAGRP